MRIQHLKGLIQYLCFTEKILQDSKKHRFLLQKYVYLLQEWKGYNWGYGFEAGRRGAFSGGEDDYFRKRSGLSNDLDEIVKTGSIRGFTPVIGKEMKDDINEVVLLSQDHKTLSSITTALFAAKDFLWAVKGLEYTEAMGKLRDHVTDVARYGIPGEIFDIVESKNMLKLR